MNLHWMIDWLQSYQQGGKVFEIQKYIFGFFFFILQFFAVRQNF